MPNGQPVNSFDPKIGATYIQLTHPFQSLGAKEKSSFHKFIQYNVCISNITQSRREVSVLESDLYQASQDCIDKGPVSRGEHRDETRDVTLNALYCIEFKKKLNSLYIVLANIMREQARPSKDSIATARITVSR